MKSLKTIRKIISLVTLIVMLFSMCNIVSFAAETGMVIYVAPNGNDSNDGSEASPLATLKGARDKVRSIKASGFPEKGITVYFRGGEYRWSETVEFTDADSGTQSGKIVYASYPGETAVFTGGVRIPGSEFTNVTDENVLARFSNRKAKENILQLDIKSYLAKLGYTDLQDYYPLWYDRYGHSGQRKADDPNKRYDDGHGLIYSIGTQPALWLARYPNKVEGFYPENPHPQYLFTGEVIKETDATKGDTDVSIFKYSDRRISKYAGYQDIYMRSFPKYLFYLEDMRIGEINSTDQTITTAVVPSDGISSNREFYLYNILDELDQEGEYFVDKASGIFYVYPNGDLKNSYLNASCFDGDYMIKTQGTSFVTFSGISFENTTGGGVFINGGEYSRVEYSDFRNIGGIALKIGEPAEVTYTPFFDFKWKDWFEGMTEPQAALRQYKYWTEEAKPVKERGQNHGVYGSVFKNIGRQAVIFAGGNFYTDEKCNYYVENNDVTFAAIGVGVETYGIHADNAHGFKINNNRVAFCPKIAIDGYITQGEICYNDVYDCVSESYDVGLLYFNYCMPTFDLKFENNYLHDVPPEFPITSPNSPLSQRSGLAFDNDHFNAANIKNNVFENIPRVMFLTDEEWIENNLFIDCYEPAYTRNITTHNYPAKNKDYVFNANEEFHVWYWTYLMTLPVFAEGETGPKVRAEWKEKWPRALDWIETTEKQLHEGKNFLTIKNNLVVNKRGYLLGSHLKFGDLELANHPISDNTNNTYTNDTSMFVDYENENYQLTEEGAKKYGLNVIDMSKIGTTDKVGTELYKETVKAPATASGGVSAPQTATIPEAVKDSVVLKIGASDALATGKAVKVDSNNANVMPNIINSRTLVPARFIAESFGGEVGWDNDTRTVTIKLNGKTVTMVLDKNELMIDGEVAAVMDVPAQSIEGRTMVPLRALCETALSKKVFWDPKGLIVVSDAEKNLDTATIDALISMLK